MNKMAFFVAPLFVLTSLVADKVTVNNDNVGEYALVNVQKLNEDYSKLVERIRVLENMVFAKKKIKPKKEALELLDTSSNSIIEGNEIIKRKRSSHILDSKTVNILNKIK